MIEHWKWSIPTRGIEGTLTIDRCANRSTYRCTGHIGVGTSSIQTGDEWQCLSDLTDKEIAGEIADQLAGLQSNVKYERIT